MGLKDRLNPLGQRVPSDKVGATNRYFKHGQSAELVNEVKKRASRISQGEEKKKERPATSRSTP